ncbi:MULTISPECIES: DUF7511 domain-containing protein [Haloferax]|uniref:DUF7511 domain-containing protein n=1 Tax=Haloferax mediterranei (strain ATCC 33500 / DSM 1411 / JCM 8866 / NBRC 14739 / NCIMB 2177 / R-4) TaxID=523841 RepID=I3RA87_HALMT|nr:hypothetical protein [Haloferax mediterranei]AFK21147.1 hypothetical protein HFX_6019 [Haloferax mediterranei ATCC 33500]MDX5990190.1 hypothetical protein [Haloferax mediterranei ATCC 33500]
MDSPPIESDEWTPPPPARRATYISHITRRADGGERCTISPVPKDEQTLLSEWVLADEGSFVSRNEMC